MVKSTDNPSSKIQPDGLRYKSKAAGTPFHENRVAASTMSCLLCGQHRPRTEGAFKLMFNARQFVCFVCRPPKVA